MGVNTEFWRGKGVFLTGHTGFKGGWLALWLSHMGANVHGYALAPPTDTNFFDATNLKDCLASHTIADIRSLDAVSTALSTSKAEIIFHLAAQPLVRYSYDHPVETYATNVMGSINVMEAARHSETVSTIVSITTDKCYENNEWVWPYRENEPMGGHDPYSSSKGCAELASSAYRRSYFVDAKVGLATARAGNVIGGGDWAADRLIPDFLRSMDAQESIVIRSPNATRPWQHVLEPLSGYLMLAEKLHEDESKFSGGWNFGPGQSDAKPVGWIVDHLCKQVPGAKWELDKQVNPHEAGSLRLDSSKAQTMLSWSPHWNIATALQKTLEWHAAWKSGAEMNLVSKEQIEQYLADSSRQR